MNMDGFKIQENGLGKFKIMCRFTPISGPARYLPITDNGFDTFEEAKEMIEKYIREKETNKNEKV